MSNRLVIGGCVLCGNLSAHAEGFATPIVGGSLVLACARCRPAIVELGRSGLELFAPALRLAVARLEGEDLAGARWAAAVVSLYRGELAEAGRPVARS